MDEERRANLVVRASQVGIIDWDAATKTAWHSERYKEILGYPPDTDSSVWPDVFDMVHPEDRERILRQFIGHLKEEGPAGSESLYPAAVEYRLKRADGSWIWVQGVGLSVRGADGRAARFLVAVTDISARRAQEEAIQDEIKLARDLIDSNPTAIFLKDQESRYLHVNRAWEETTGLTAAQAIGRRVGELIGGESGAKFDAQDLELLRQGSGSSTVEYSSDRTGRLRHFVLNKSVLRRSDGSVRGLVGTITEVTAQKQHEQALREQVELIRDLIHSMPNPLFLKDASLRFVHVNPAWEKMSGISAEKAVGGTVHEVYPPNFAADFERQDQELLASPTGTHTMEITIPGRKRTRHYILSKALLRREDGSLRGMVGSCTDITDLKRADQAVRENEERMRFWLENIPIPIAVYDPEGRVQHLNPSFAATFGWHLEEMRGQRMPFVPPDRQHELAGVLQKLRTAGRDAFETQRFTRDGRLLDVYISTGMARDSDGSPRATMVSLTDVTARKRMERELAASREEAMQAAQAKAAFLAAMSHEIRTPLNGVLGMAGLLADTRLSAEQRDYVDTIRVSGDALLSVINDILDYSKIESGRMELEQEAFEPMRAVEESLEILGERARAKRLELIAEAEDAVPQWVRGDFARLRQVLVNLVGNAVKFTERGEVIVQMRAGAAGTLEFSVTDTGIGIPRERLDALFQPFTQADASTTRKYGGTGLGLAISKRLVGLMGGELHAASEPGRGSTFAFTVTVSACEAPPLTRPVAPVELAGRRILIVDDNATNLRILRRQLERWGALPIAASSGAEALQKLVDGERYDAALLDYHMPGMDGVMLARRIRALKARLPLVLLSSSMYRRADEAEAGLFVAQLLKPVRQTQLREAIAAALAGARKPARARSRPVSRPKTAALKALVVDDVEVNCRLAQALLRKLGHASETASSGLEALEKLRAGRYDVVLLDVQMPDIDGLEVARRIHIELGASAPRLVAMTANAMPGDRERCLAAGMDGYLAKPLDPKALAAEVGTQPGALIDHARIEALLEYDDKRHTMLRGIIDAFLRDAPGYLDAARAAQKRADGNELARSAHALKGAAANTGARLLSEAAARLEALSLNASADELASQVKALASTYEQTAKALRKLSRP